MARRNSYKFILNPNAGGGSAIAKGEKLEKILKEIGVDFQIFTTEYAGHAEILASKIHSTEDIQEVVVAVGGDGTLHEVASGLLAISEKERPHFAFVPSGTGNDYQKMFNNGSKLEDQLSNIVHVPASKVDAAEITWEDESGGGQAFYINLAGFGFDAMAAARQQSQKTVKGAIGYLLAVVATLANKKAFRVEIEIFQNGKWSSVFKDDLLLANIGMGKSAGGLFKINPHAILDDGLFEYCCVADLSIPRILTLIPKVIRGSHWETRFVTKGRTGELRITAPNGLPMQTDGEVLSLSARKVHIKILPGALMVRGKMEKGARSPERRI